MQSVRIRFRTWIKRMLITLAVLFAIFLLVIVPYGISYLITHARTRPADRRLTESPADYQIPYRDIWLQVPAAPGDSSNRIPIHAWYMPHENPRAVIVYAHGLFRSRHEMLERAAWLWQHGFAGVLMDLRRHGESGGEISGLGFLERLDVETAVHYVRNRLNWRGPVVAFGVSMGAAAVLLAAAETPDIDIVIVDSPFLSFENTITHHLKLVLGLPRFPIGDLIMLYTRRRIGFETDEFDLQKAVRQLNDRPILFIAGTADRRMPVAMQRRLYEQAATRYKTFITIPDATHGAAFRTHRDMYEQAALQFLDDALKRVSRHGGASGP